MFEDSLVASRVARVPTAKRWAFGGAFGVQCVLAVLAMTLPMLHPAALTVKIAAPPVWIPVMRKAPVPVRERQVQHAASAAASAPVAETKALRFPTAAPRQGSAEDAPPMAAMPFGSGMGDSVPVGLAVGDGHGPRVSVAPARAAGPVRISKGVTDGMLLAPIRPVYPAIARAAGVQGTVIVEAVISQAGAIESLRVVSGPEMLRGAAVEAIRAARYKPYLLNGSPTAVETTITVNFMMGG
ncbi:TonB family protein [Edaphobacter sp.]|uniref:energy transducer TonB n=1 Tax=Edaphobacter sp. TaxID=1934404 RepID=UPI002DBA81D6|nr:TonB family protein [Edaphobacter sp.]HEU5340921.1 TonB family protein [Edaphobacter sp.]